MVVSYLPTEGFKAEELKNSGFENYTINHLYNLLNPKPDATNGQYSCFRVLGNGEINASVELYLIEFMWQCLRVKTNLFSTNIKEISCLLSHTTHDV